MDPLCMTAFCVEQGSQTPVKDRAIILLKRLLVGQDEAAFIIVTFLQLLCDVYIAKLINYQRNTGYQQLQSLHLLE